MCLIPCDDDCVYQNDGYCLLETPTVITNKTGKGCVHYIKAEKEVKKEQKTIHSKPQMLL